MIKLINYLKFISIFLIVELMITFIMSLLNLIGVNSGITTIIMLVSNLMLFFILNYFNAFKLKKKGFLEGISLGGIFILIMILIKMILFHGLFSISTIIYYLILFITSIIGGMFGVNKKSDEK